MASTAFYIGHVDVLQVIFATVPPPEYWSGGPCFVVSVLYIGGGVQHEHLTMAVL